MDRLSRLSLVVAALGAAAASSSLGCDGGGPASPSSPTQAQSAALACGSLPACGPGEICQGDTCVPRANTYDDGGIPTVGCFTPCSADVVTPDGVLTCLDSYIQGCIGSQTCTQGVCVNPDAGAPTCTQDNDCPEWTRCIPSVGRCYSECTYPSDCNGDSQCYEHVCRPTCQAAADCAGTPGTKCQLLDDTAAGVCMPDAKPSTQPPVLVTPPPPTVTPDSFGLTAISPNATFTVTNNAQYSTEFHLTKVLHIEYTPTGSQEIDTNPMPWMTVGASGDGGSFAAALTNDLKIVLPAGGTETIQLANAGTGIPPKWQGTLSVVQGPADHPIQTHAVHLGYAAGANGRWAGKMYSFAQFGDQNIDAWAKNAAGKTIPVGNALVQKWTALRRGTTSLDDFQAAFTAVSTATWRSDAVCNGAGAACYLSSAGVMPLTQNQSTTPVPTGVTELPIALDLQMASTTQASGRIASDESLQYPGNPAFSMTFDLDPTTCAPGIRSVCLATVQMSAIPAGDTIPSAAISVVGGRYTDAPDPTTGLPVPCGTGFVPRSTPWLVPGFLGKARLDTGTGAYYVDECRAASTPTADLNLDVTLAAGNPIPDGNGRSRRITILDGAIVNQSVLYLLVRESFQSFLDADPAGFSSYGMVVLKRSAAQLDPSAFAGSQQTAAPPSNIDVKAACPSSLIATATSGQFSSLTTANVPAVFQAMTGGSLTASPVAYPVASIHYICHDTGKFDTSAPCRAGSGVTYFTGASIPADLTTQSCNADGSCQKVLDQWKDQYGTSLVVDPVWRCTDPAVSFCDSNRDDLRADKTFFQKPAEVPFAPALTETAYAFRFKTEFANRQGTNLAFAPSVCVPGSSAVPYCYDPKMIEELRARIDCAVAIYAANTTLTDAQWPAWPAAKDFLHSALAFKQDNPPGGGMPIVHEGFADLDAQLMIMMGDDAYTAAFQSRFDLSDSAIVAFEGSKFEPKGIDLSGVAGYEMFTLYEATEYYQSVLDRFYALVPHLWRILNGNAARSFVSADMVTTYFNRVLRASTQKAQAWSEIATRYQRLNRPDFARGVLQRAYSATYLESVIMSRMMQGIVAVAAPDPSQPNAPDPRAQIRKQVETSATSFGIALLNMRNVYASFSDSVNYFGFSPDYIPMPALQPTGPNSFETLLASAQQLMATAKEKEDLAIGASHTFNTDAAAFQAQLAQIANTYDNQLADICGTFQGDDGQYYPATKAYAQMGSKTKLVGDPCGMVGTGSIHDALLALEESKADLDRVRANFDKVNAAVQIETARVTQQCNLIGQAADFNWEQAGQKMSLNQEIASEKQSIGDLQAAMKDVAEVATLSKCIVGVATDCPSAALALGIFVAASALEQQGVDSIQSSIDSQQNQIASIDRDTAKWNAGNQCQMAQADSQAKTATMMLDLKGIEIDRLRTQLDIEIKGSAIRKLANQAAMLEAQEQENQQLAINTEAAKNDPTVRIYKNDAILTADRTFYDAVAEAYKATRMFEYYTSQSFAKLDELSLVRMVSRGDYSLEGYLRELQQAYTSFQEAYSNPDTRVARISLMDDILHVPRLDASGNAISLSDRVNAFRAAIGDPKWLDANGYRTFPFATTLQSLSPLTRDHKILYVEAQINASLRTKTDDLGRVYLRQAGTSTVASVDGDKRYYRLPPDVAVINTFFGSKATYSEDVYKNLHLRDRPFVNTSWELVFNQRDEAVNQDINLNELNDIILYVYYTDFTAL